MARVYASSPLAQPGEEFSFLAEMEALIRLADRQALQGILFVLHTGIAWRQLPQELGFGSGSTCWRRLDEWTKLGVWGRLHLVLLERLQAAGELDWSRAVADSSHVVAKKGAPRRARARLAEPKRALSITS